MSSDLGYPGGVDEGDESSNLVQQDAIQKANRDFPRLTKLISTNIQKLQSNVEDIKRMVEQIGTPTDSTELRDRLRQRQQFTSKLAKDTAKAAKEVKDMPSVFSGHEKRHRKAQVDRLISDYSDVLKRFQAVQKEAAKKEKASIAKSRAGSTSHDQNDDSQSDRQGGMQTQDQVTLSQEELQDLQEQQAAILELERNIVDVNEIFRELATMVEDQGEKLDSIEANMEKTGTKIQSATVHLKEAETSKKSLRKKYIACGIVGLVLLVVLVLIIYFSVTG